MYPTNPAPVALLAAMFSLGARLGSHPTDRGSRRLCSSSGPIGVAKCAAGAAVLAALFIASFGGAAVAQSELHDAARIGQVEEVRALLDAGADVEATDYNGNTPLHIVATVDEADVARVLIRAGADVDARNAYGETPLHLTVVANSEDAARVLIRAGADVDARDNIGNTPCDYFLAKLWFCN